MLLTVIKLKELQAIENIKDYFKCFKIFVKTFKSNL